MGKFVKCITLAAALWAGSSQAADAPFTLTSSAAASLGRMPAMNTCDGQDVSPPLAWSGAPTGTQTYALVVSDPDAPSKTFYHWVWFNIPNSTTQLPSAALPPGGTVVGNNSHNSLGYYGPCPPPGHVHRYIFTLYALNASVAMNSGTDAGSVLGAIQPNILGQAQYIMVYNR
jgi:Raf kinase inhibitor-like YbhB/YbcL family protein